MTVDVQTPFNEHTGNGVTTNFGYTFLLIDEGDLKVYLDGVLQDSADYTVSGVGVDAGGSVVFDTAPANLVAVLLSRDLPLERSTDYQSNGDLPSETVDNDFDRLWQALQQQKAQLAGVVRAPYPETIGAMPSAADRAGKFLAFDVDGEPMAAAAVTEAPATTFMISLLDDEDAPEARETLGLQDVAYLHDHGAVGDGTTDDTAAVVAALATGLRVLGDPAKTYAVTGAITLAAGAYMQDVSLKQLAPAATTSVRTLTSSSGNNITLRNVKVDRNGAGSGGALATAAGIWISGGSGHFFERVEVTGDDMGTGFVVENASNFIARDLYVHDIDYLLGVSPGDDRVQGVWFNGCADFHPL
jgi:hypothetical protein